MAEDTRRQGFEGLTTFDPGGGMAAWAAPPAGQVVIRASVGDVDALAGKLGFALAASSNLANTDGDVTTFRLGPDQWLAVHDTDARFGRDLEDMVGVHALDQTSSRARLRLRGAASRDLLAVGAAIDLKPKAFPAGAFAQTTVGNATAVLHAREADLFDAYIARSFAQSWLAWLCHAGREFDLRIAGEASD